MRSPFPKTQIHERNQIEWKVYEPTRVVQAGLGFFYLNSRQKEEEERGGRRGGGGGGEKERKNLTVARETEKLHFLNRRKTNFDQLKKICLLYIKTVQNCETNSSAMLLVRRNLFFSFLLTLISCRQLPKPPAVPVCQIFHIECLLACLGDFE